MTKAGLAPVFLFARCHLPPLRLILCLTRVLHASRFPSHDPHASRLPLEIGFSKNYPLMIRWRHWKSLPVLTMFQRHSTGVCRGIPGDMRLNAARLVRLGMPIWMKC
jgi:hypothetical protein